MNDGGRERDWRQAIASEHWSLRKHLSIMPDFAGPCCAQVLHGSSCRCSLAALNDDDHC